MSTRKPTTQIDRFVTSLRSWIRRAADTRDAGRRSPGAADAPPSGATAVSATSLAARERREPDREGEPETPDADTSLQDEPTGPTGASVDEFDEGTAPTEHPDLGDVEEAAEPDPDADVAGPERSVDATEAPVASSVDTDGAIDGTLAADRLPFDDAITETDLPADEALAAIDAADLDAAETAAANAFAGDEDLGSTPALLGADDDPSTDDTVLPEDEEDVADLTGPPVDRSGFPDLSMDGDTDYEVAGYPSDHMDGEERSDPDDAGLYERETMEMDPDDEADRSEGVGTLGLADSETIAEADTSTDAASPMPIDTGDIGVGGMAEIDDTSMLTDADLATDTDTVRGDPDLADAADEHVDDDWLAPVEVSDAIDTDSEPAPTARDLDADPTDLHVPEPPGGADIAALGAPNDMGAAPVDEVMAVEPDGVAMGASDEADAGLPPGDVASEPDAASTMAIAATDGGGEGRVRGDGSGTCPAGYPVKGNASSKIYHVPGSASYQATRAEWCFASEEVAVAAGYRAPGKRNQSGRRRR